MIEIENTNDLIYSYDSFECASNSESENESLDPVSNESISNSESCDSDSEEYREDSDESINCSNQLSVRVGLWSAEEHKASLDGYKLYGRKWTKIAREKITSRTPAQIKNHANTYFAKLWREKADIEVLVPSLSYDSDSDESSDDLLDLPLRNI